ncbi:MAG: nuclear transport factor 2 family protein [Candidatus Odinarchaeota archaeon]
MSDPEYENIHKSIATFVEGLRTLDYATISQIFFEDGLSLGVRNGQISYVRRDHWKEMRDQEVAAGIDNTDNVAWFEIKSFERFGNAASVVIELSFTSDPFDYIDLYHMLKTDDGWKIVNKIYHHIEKKKR